MATKNQSKGKSKGKSENQNSKPVRCGALWKSKSGKALQGVIEPDGKDGKKVRVFIIKNGYKESDNQPDYLIFLSNNTTDGKRGNKNDDEVPF